jgi:hypothetical protein
MTPAVTVSNYISYMVTPYNRCFAALGYPELDIQEWDDGEWAILQYHKAPIIPSLTPWSYVLQKMRHVPKTMGTFKRWTDQLDLEKRHIWAEQEASERRARESAEADDRHQSEFRDKAFNIIKRNPHLMERVAKNGLQELKLSNISRNIPNACFRR